MLVVFGFILGTMALCGVIKCLLQMLFSKLSKQENNHWILANFLTIVLRMVFAFPRLWGDSNLFLNLFIIGVIYALEQIVWFVYDYIQQKRNNASAGWGLICGIICGGTLWLFLIRLATAYVVQILVNQ